MSSINPGWRADYEHALAHYAHGAPSDFHCEGGDQCTLNEPDDDDHNAQS